MKPVIRVMAKEVKRFRALVELMKEHGSANQTYFQRAELETLRRMLALMIKTEAKL